MTLAPGPPGEASGPDEGACLSCALAELNGRFARALDHHDSDVLRSVFTDDASYGNDREVWHGLAQIEAGFSVRWAGATRTTRHTFSGLVARSRSAHEAEVSSVWVCYAANATPPVDAVGVSMVADFSDVVRRVPDGSWRIASRRIRGVFRDPALAPERR
jgi:hypothetical protein